MAQSISDLRISLSNPGQVQYIDRETQQLITTTSSSSRKALQSELDKTIEDRNNINLKLEVIQDSIMSLDTRLLDLEISNEDERELGPLKYLAETTGRDMDQVVNWFLLLIIFVFDPLAIAMVIAANFAFAQIKTTPMFEMSDITQDEVFAMLNTKDDVEEEQSQESMIKKNEEILATPKEDIYKEKEPPSPPPVVKSKTAYW